jgi:hypothetical protein
MAGGISYVKWLIERQHQAESQVRRRNQTVSNEKPKSAQKGASATSYSFQPAIDSDDITLIAAALAVSAGFFLRGVGRRFAASQAKAASKDFGVYMTSNVGKKNNLKK